MTTCHHRAAITNDIDSTARPPVVRRTVPVISQRLRCTRQLQTSATPTRQQSDSSLNFSVVPTVHRLSSPSDSTVTTPTDQQQPRKSPRKQVNSGVTRLEVQPPRFVVWTEVSEKRAVNAKPLLLSCGFYNAQPEIYFEGVFSHPFRPFPFFFFPLPCSPFRLSFLRHEVIPQIKLWDLGQRC